MSYIWKNRADHIRRRPPDRSGRHLLQTVHGRISGVRPTNVLHKAKWSIQTKDIFFQHKHCAPHRGGLRRPAGLAGGGGGLQGPLRGERRKEEEEEEGRRGRGKSNNYCGGNWIWSINQVLYRQSAEVCWRRYFPRTLRGLWKSWSGGGKRVKSKYKQTKRTWNVVLLKAQCLKPFYP